MADAEDQEEVEQNELDRQIRTSKALQAMERELQLSTAVVMPVLLKLLKTFDGKWVHIEDENYRVLADAIFQQQESAETEKAPGSSSGGRKGNGKKKGPLAMRASPRRAPRNSKRAESDDSDENGHSQELIRRSKRVPAEAFTHAAGMASLERAVVSKRGRPSTAARQTAADVDDDPAWEPPLALPAPPRATPPQQCQEPQLGGERRQPRRASTGAQFEIQFEKQFEKQVTTMERGTQTEAADFEASTLQELIQPTAMICYEEPNEPIQEPVAPPTPITQQPDVQPMAFVKPEAQQILSHVVPLKCRLGEVCHKCEKPKAIVPGEKSKPPSNSLVSDPLTSLVFDPSRVKVEGGAASDSKREDMPLMCLNPEPLQTMVPTSHQPLALAAMEHFEVHSPEPLLLTFPCEDEGAAGERRELAKETVPCSVKASIAELPKEVVVPCSVKDSIAELPKESEPSSVKAPIAEVPKVLVPCSVRAPICELPKVLRPFSVRTSVAEPVKEVVPSSVGGSIAELPKESEPGLVKAPIAEVPKLLVPCAVRAPIAVEMQVDTDAGSSLEPENVPSEIVVENPLMSVKVEVGLSSKVEVEVKVAEGSSQVEVQRPTENFITEGALAALASYISESDSEDTDMSPKLKSRVRTSAPVEDMEGVEPGKGKSQEEVQGVLPLANTSSIAVLADASSRTEDLPEKGQDSGAVVDPPKLDKILPTLSAEVGEVARNSQIMITLNVANPNDATQPLSDIAPLEEKKQSSGNTSSESSKKRKRHLIKKHEQEQREQEVMTEKRIQRIVREDISRGKEKMRISLSASNGEDLPKGFYYITSSVVYQSAHVGISMARIGEDDRCTSCVGNCLDNRTPCECTRLTTGEYAYTVEGQLYPSFLKQELERKTDMKYLAFCPPGACPSVERTSDETCKGHVQRRFIKECWDKCGCTQLCGNRIVQRGIGRKLQVFWTECGKGWGVRTLEHLPAGTFVCEYVGEILTNTEMWNRNNVVHREAKHHFALQLDADWCSEKILKDEEALCLDGTFYGNIARFINHRCYDSNLIEIPVEIESPDHHYYHLAFFTSKDVVKNEELTWDYQLDFNDKDHQLQAFDCLCGSPYCRGKASWV
ncbi:hypothetical protein KC19_1G127600 [Ceratodon purpureus]|uniref:Uncharacterized protein n=1 Tax=Ceratodon purpureus TaxID=3225 RepID=A0A8T0J761_CERPU|nr:hypothetical protein KC19_1G127600 [Ceratodon purpureus]